MKRHAILALGLAVAFASSTASGFLYSDATTWASAGPAAGGRHYVSAWEPGEFNARAGATEPEVKIETTKLVQWGSPYEARALAYQLLDAADAAEAAGAP